jgi:membrane dipeptidase
MLIVDGHEDIAWNALTFGRDPTRSALYYRSAEVGTDAEKHGGMCTLGLPEWLLGHVGIIFATLFSAPITHRIGTWDTQIYADTEEAHRRVREQLDFYHRLAGEHPLIELIDDQSQLEAIAATWTDEAGEETSLIDRRVGLIPLMEGADPIRHPGEVEEWFERGLRIVGLAWDATRYAGGTWIPGPLTDLGRELLEALADLNMILDLSHADEPAYLEALDRYEGPVIASHSNPRRFTPGRRGLSDEMIEQLIERDGVTGIVLYNRFLNPDYHLGDPKSSVTLSDVVAAIDYVCQLAGNAHHVGIGSDFDGGFGAQQIPEGLDTVADLSKIGDALAEYGYTSDEVAGVLGGNWLRLLRHALPD